MTGAIRAFAVPAAVRFEFAIVAVAKERVVVGVGFQVDAAAVAAIAPGRAAARHEFLAAKCYAPVSTVSSFHKYLGFINKHSNKTPGKKIT